MPRTGLSAPEIKQKAIEATIESMRREGFDKVRLSDIARQLGLSHAALYAHFKDKAALFDAVSEGWLSEMDASLERVCKKTDKSPAERIQAWMLALHRAKLAKVRNDPELYKSFDLHAGQQKAHVQRHMSALRTQLTGLVSEAIEARRLRGADPEKMTEIIWESMMAFHHPKLVAQHLDEKREPLLKRILESVMRGLKLTA